MTELYDKFISNRQWQGKLKVDDGFGLQTRNLGLSVVDAVVENYNKLKGMPFFLEPKVAVPNIDQLFGIKAKVYIDGHDDSDSEPESFYLVIVPIDMFDEFLRFVKSLRKTCGVKIEGEFYSIHTDNKYDYPLYKLLFTLSPDTDNKPQYELSEGSWTPNFTSTKRRAGWIDMPEFYIEVDGKLVDGVKTLDAAIKESNEKEESEKRLKEWKREHLKGTAGNTVFVDDSQDLKEEK